MNYVLSLHTNTFGGVYITLHLILTNINNVPYIIIWQPNH